MRKLIEHVDYDYDTDTGKYTLLATIIWWEQRYHESVTVPPGFPSDGATHAIDIASISWWIHDYLYTTHQWDSGRPCSPWQAAMTLHDVLKKEGYFWQAYTWPLATFATHSIYWNSRTPPYWTSLRSGTERSRDNFETVSEQQATAIQRNRRNETTAVATNSDTLTDQNKQRLRDYTHTD